MVVEITDLDADTVEMPHLPKHHFPIAGYCTELKFKHSGSHKRCMIKRRQVPIEPGFAMTVHRRLIIVLALPSIQGFTNGIGIVFGGDYDAFRAKYSPSSILIARTKTST